MIQKERIRILNEKPAGRGQYVLYWMQASQRAECNHALEYAVERANGIQQPVVVFFGLSDHFPEGNERHYAFMLEGLHDVRKSLEKRGIRLLVLHQSPEKGAVALGKRASLVVVDRGYLRIQRAWRQWASRHLECPLVQVESDVVVPVEETSPKEEYAAATIRPKISRKLDAFFVPLREKDPGIDSLSLDFESFDIDDVDRVLSRLRIDRSVRRVHTIHGGSSEAQKHLRVFLEEKLDDYAELRNDPTLDFLSQMSPYLHFGQISPLSIALQVRKTRSPGQEAYLEELIVRRELSMNFSFYNETYDRFDSIPEWAKKTLKDHAKDRRDPLYDLEALETAQTHDPYWNAAQKEMVLKGKMHGYMRMYWGKKILEWTRTPEEAYRIAIALNNKYEIDGRDPNGFAGVAWCFGKHDRPWGERGVFGSVRYMNANGLKRKFDADGYAQMVNQFLWGS